MATPAEPATSAIFRALRSVDVDPDLAYEAAEESRRQAGENVIAVLGAKIDAQGARIDAQIAELKAEIDVRGARVDAQITELKAEIDARGARVDAQITELKAEIRAQGSRIEDLRHVVWRVIWPLVVLLAVPIFGLLYEALTS